MYINILTRELPDLHPPAQTLNTQISKFNNLWPFPVAYFINTAKCKGPIWNFFFFFFFYKLRIPSLTRKMIFSLTHLNLPCCFLVLDLISD